MGYSANWDSTDQVAGARGRRRLARPLRQRSIRPTGASRTATAWLARVAALGRDVGDAGRGLRHRLQAEPLLELHLLPGRSRTRATSSSRLDDRNVYGAEGDAPLVRATGSACDAENEVGFQGRFDDIHSIGLFHTRRARAALRRRALIGSSSGAARSSSRTTCRGRRKFRTILGVRGDVYHFDVTGISDPGERRHGHPRHLLAQALDDLRAVRPDRALRQRRATAFTPTTRAARPSRVDPVDRRARASRVTPLARAKSGRGRRAEHARCRGWQTTVAVWGLDIDSELIFVGDAGSTEASRPSRRYGVEWSNYYRVLPWMTLDARLLATRRRASGTTHPAGQLHPGRRPERRRRRGLGRQLGDFFGQPAPPLLRPAAADRGQQHPLERLDHGQRSCWATSSSAGCARRSRSSTSSTRRSPTSTTSTRRGFPGEPAGGVDDVHFHPTAAPLGAGRGRLRVLARSQNRSERQLRPPSIFWNSDIGSTHRRYPRSRSARSRRGKPSAKKTAVVDEDAVGGVVLARRDADQVPAVEGRMRGERRR